MAFGRETLKTGAQQAIYDIVKFAILGGAYTWLRPTIEGVAVSALEMGPRAALAWAVLATVVVLFLLLMVFDSVAPYIRRQKHTSVPDKRTWVATEQVSGKHFLNETVQVDGRIFKKCTFRDVTLEFAGTAPFRFIECKFANAANNKIYLMSTHLAVNTFVEAVEFIKQLPGFGTLGIFNKDIDTGEITPLPPLTRIEPLHPVTPRGPSSQEQLRPSIEAVDTSGRTDTLPTPPKTRAERRRQTRGRRKS